jgi:hypothetical protein
LFKPQFHRHDLLEGANERSICFGPIVVRPSSLIAIVAIFVSDRRQDSIAYSEIRYAAEQGISKRVAVNFFGEQGNLIQQEREWIAKDAWPSGPNVLECRYRCWGTPHGGVAFTRAGGGGRLQG